jgi:hypothetical protein
MKIKIYDTENIQSQNFINGGNIHTPYTPLYEMKNEIYPRTKINFDRI